MDRPDSRAILETQMAIECALTSEFLTSRNGTLVLTDEGRRILRPLISSWGWTFPEAAKPFTPPRDQQEAVRILYEWGEGEAPPQEDFLYRIHAGLMSGKYRGTTLESRFTSHAAIEGVTTILRHFLISPLDFHVLFGVFVLECYRSLR